MRFVTIKLSLKMKTMFTPRRAFLSLSTSAMLLIKLHSLSYTWFDLDLITVAFLDSLLCDFPYFLSSVCAVSKLTFSEMTLEEGYIRVDTVRFIFRFSLQVARYPQCVAGLVNLEQKKSVFLNSATPVSKFSRPLRRCTKFRS